ncbi:inorganic phosphate transporter [Fulvivirga maritima]|uniref:inorganic phosphate transporter n=1 Tax=Fulvivirga maritima TaxID=2904247 RepID=UPI001F163F62|nr:inorganic phosphate transporter [Fulvivirga maritima]UII28564.1 inorganic phosphate transporter [Fulvivirga maritima]
MQQVYLILIILLFALAITDLIVGVSNDAVNFLNSAIGSKVAPRHVILIVASIGIILGATFSSGIMEVARKGIFFPDHFYFADVMVIFLAVMLTDIILLDLFNTFAMPTSTTVSIVFELLGASFAVALMKTLQDDSGLSIMHQYINFDNALTIVSSIFISVAVSFTVGMIVQYFSRVLFTFQYEKRMKTVGVIWAGIALTAISYFLIIKGVKGSSFISDDKIEWFERNSLEISIFSFLAWSVIFFILREVFKTNILKIVVLFGTFALAMAFAGNDLVNFIGVPIAGLESFKEWSASGLDPHEMFMTSLSKPVKTNTYLLLAAGIIMVLTLWLSKKAKSVTETEVNLGRQDAGSERFKANAVSRGIVQGARGIGKGLTAVVPKSVLSQLEENFDNEVTLNTDDAPAFDLVRASVNLTVASILIAFATSLKLPLSTTYVSFMVAMGSSLSDRAWGRDSAVYRVSGVINVILGWLGTAVIAFLISSIFAFLIFKVGLSMVAVILVIAVITIYRSFTYHKEKERKKTLAEKLLAQTSLIPVNKALIEANNRTRENLSMVTELYKESLGGLFIEKKKPLKKSRKTLNDLIDRNEKFKANLIKFINRMDENEGNTSKTYLNIYDLEQDFTHSIKFIIEESLNHVKNMHSSLTDKQVEGLKELTDNFVAFMTQAVDVLEENSNKKMNSLITLKRVILDQILSLMEFQIKEVRKKGQSKRTSTLFFNILLETKEMVNTTSRFIKVFKKAGFNGHAKTSDL